MEHEPITLWGWISPRPGLVAGYVQDPQGEMRLYAVLQYPPITSATMRAISLRQLDDPQTFDGPAWKGSGPPPSPQELEAAWDGRGAVADTRWEQWMQTLGATDSEKAALLTVAQGDLAKRLESLQAEPEQHLAPSALQRWPMDTPEAFSRRVADAYLLLAAETATPTKRIAEIAGVSQAAATSWVHRARSRSFIPPAELMKESSDG